MSRYSHLETGGELFGLTMHSGAPVVYRATGPSIAARHHATSFFQDGEFIVSANAVAWEAGLQHLGSWHSHHHIGLAEPSAGDVNTAHQALNETGWPNFLMMIGNFPHRDERAVTIGATLFSADQRSGTAALGRVLTGKNAFSHLRFTHEATLPAATPTVEIRAPRTPARWFQASSVARRIAAEVRAFQPLAAIGIDASMFGAGDELEVRARQVHAQGKGQGVVTLLLGEGFPEKAPKIIIPKLLHAPIWRSDSTIAELVHTLLTTPACAPPTPSNRLEPAEPFSLLHRSAADQPSILHHGPMQ